MGPLKGIKVIEIAGIGPGPVCAMMLADMGADVLRIDRAGAPGVLPVDPKQDVLNRGRRSVALDLKKRAGVDVVLALCERADVLMEGFRPGVMERLGLGPDDCFARNERLIYGRMTGWGQDGPMKDAAGHDINYIALAGALHSFSRAGHAPVPPLNLVGDFGGGGMMLAFGMVCALIERQSSGRGQVVDAAMIDGTAALMAMFHGMAAQGLWRPEPGRNLLDTGAPFYDVYQTSDGEYVAIGALEPQFFAELIARLGLADDPDFAAQHDRRRWPAMRAKLDACFKEKTRDQWRQVLEGSDACFAPVLSYAEAPEHEHIAARGTFVDAFGIRQPAPAPRFSRTTPEIAGPPPAPGEHGAAALADWGVSDDQIDALKQAEAVA